MAEKKNSENGGMKVFPSSVICGVVAIFIGYYFFPRETLLDGPGIMASLAIGLGVFFVTNWTIIELERQGLPLNELFVWLRWLCGLRERGREYQTGEMMNMNLRLSATVFVAGIILMYFLFPWVTAWSGGAISGPSAKSIIVICPSVLAACFTFMGACYRGFKRT